MTNHITTFTLTIESEGNVPGDGATHVIDRITEIAEHVTQGKHPYAISLNIIKENA